MQPHADIPMRKVIWRDIELINEVAEKRNYNRQIDLPTLKKEVKKQIKSMGYENFDEVFFAAKEIMIHEHKNGEKCAPHMRIGIWFPDNIQVYVDCDLQLWDSFERILSPFKEHVKPKLRIV
jgi:hypothetical protein|tara:strand:+ start:157 stop:522 length:366 start_codon:yes stop_codon:yes gene_type:complete